jgi:hypothetical protein
MSNRRLSSRTGSYLFDFICIVSYSMRRIDQRLESVVQFLHLRAKGAGQRGREGRILGPVPRERTTLPISSIGIDHRETPTARKEG